MPDVLERLKKLDDEREALRNEAKRDALAAAEAGVDTLRQLGFAYRLVEGAVPSPKKGTRTVKDEACSICGSKTNPPHDKRSHRSQEQKRPFTVAELEAKGLSKV